jgi:dolichol-phosphate mannosyltransferase
LLVLGIIGIYLGKVFDESKNRPLFIIEKTINTEKEK